MNKLLWPLLGAFILGVAISGGTYFVSRYQPEQNASARGFPWAFVRPQTVYPSDPSCSLVGVIQPGNAQQPKCDLVTKSNFDALYLRADLLFWFLISSVLIIITGQIYGFTKHQP